MDTASICSLRLPSLTSHSALTDVTNRPAAANGVTEIVASAVPASTFSTLEELVRLIPDSVPEDTHYSQVTTHYVAVRGLGQ